MGSCSSKEGQKDEYAIPKPEYKPASVQLPTPQSSSETPVLAPLAQVTPATTTHQLPPTPASPPHLNQPYTRPPATGSYPKKPMPQDEPVTVPSKKYSYQAQLHNHQGDKLRYDIAAEYAREQQAASSGGRATRPGAVAVSGHTPNYQPQQPKRPSNPRERPPPRPPNQKVPPVQESKEDYSQYYEKGKNLGSGAFATVFVGTKRTSGKDYAIKCIDRAKMNWGGRDALQDEIFSLKSCKGGPNIVQLYQVFTPNSRECFLVMELLEGGELFECILKKRTFTEKEARKVIYGLLSALDFMHSRRIAHRDLKPENLLLVSKESDTDIKLADMGFAKKMNTYNGYRTLCGTPGYMAPEVLERYPSYDMPCDLFSAGVIMFVLLGGYLPFDDESEDLVFDRTRNAQYEFYPDYWKHVSAPAKSLVVKMLTVNPSKRISADRALRHEWMTQGEERLPKKRLSIVSRMHESKFTVKTADDKVERIQQLNKAFDSYLTKCDDDTATVFTMGTMNRNTKPAVKPDSEKGLPFKKFYKTGETLGKGGFGVVKRASHTKTNESRAVKIVDRLKLEDHGKESLKDEIAALKLLRGGPHIIRLIDVFEEKRYTYIVMEEMNGGELLKRIVDKEVYTEREARSVCKMLFSAIDYCHKKKIAHRDLKPENLLLAEVGDDTSIKVVDFGFAKRVRKPNCLSTLCGTASYVAPEVLDLTSKGYDERCDNWSCGVIMYILLGGYAPFEGPVDELANLILKGDFEFHENYWRDTSVSAKNLISACLQVDPDHRITAEEVLSSDWMSVEEETLTGNDLTVAQEQIKKSLPVEKLKGAVYTVMLAQNLGESLTDFDTDANVVPQTRKQTNRGDNRKKHSASLSNSMSDDPTAGKLFYELYNLGNALGSGSFSVVHEAISKQSTEEVAVKVVDRRGLHPADAVALQDEIVALKEVVTCPHIVELYEVFEEPDTTFLVMEKMRGGDLIEQIISKSHYTEADAKAVCRNLLLGVQYCHSKSIANRNIKPENLLLSTTENSVDVKLSDFCYAKKVLYPNSLRTQCGTEGYTAPEILEHRPEYDVMCDIWSLGVVLYILIGGYRPFRGSGTEIMRQIRYGEYEFHDRFWSHVSYEAKDLIRRMMTVDPRDRISASDALQSDWMMADDSTLVSDLGGNQAELRTFKGKAKMRQVVQMMVAMNKLQGLAESFQMVDNFDC